MIQKYVYGTPFETEAVKTEVGKPAYGQITSEDGFCFTYVMGEEDIVYGLGEANRGLNKRGYRYFSDCTDGPNHIESMQAMYAAHNFLVLAGEKTFGLFFDYPAKMVFDIGYTRADTLTVSCDRADLNLYVIEGESAYDIVKQFRRMTGKSYIPPKFAFGYGQSRWGYKTKEDFRQVVNGYRSRHIPLDMVYMDIDYMQDYKDFTLNPETFADFPAFVKEMKEQGIRLIPIIDAGVKVEKGYPVYEEGVKNRYFCQREDGSDFVAAVWPGDTHFPDVLNPKARRWFGDQYRFLTEQGIEGFWNDMNEPSIFYTPEAVEAIMKSLQEALATTDGKIPLTWLRGIADQYNIQEEYKRFYHQVGEERIRHDQVHNLFGYNMTRAAAEGLERVEPDKRFLLFSRSSYIGMHRYGGIWTGDNCSWWSHILLNLKMMASLNMCGFLYTGADLGHDERASASLAGFGSLYASDAQSYVVRNQRSRVLSV